MASLKLLRKRNRYRLTWRDINGKLKIRIFPADEKEKAKAACREAEMEEAKRRMHGTQEGTSVSDILLSDYAERWLGRTRLRVQEGDLAEASYNLYAAHWRLRLQPHLGSIPLRQITRKQVVELLMQFRDPKHPERIRSKSTVRGAYVVLHTMLNHAVNVDQILDENPAIWPKGIADIKLTHSSKEVAQRIQTKILLPAQLSAFETACRQVLPEHAAMLLVMARCGLRLGEALGLWWADVDEMARTLRLQRAWCRGKVQPLKNHLAATIDLSLEAMAVLKAHRAVHRQRAMALGLPDSPWIFLGPRGVPHCAGVIQRDFGLILRAAGINQKITPHGLRHTYATLLLGLGVPIQYVRKQMRHHSITLTVDLYGSWEVPAKYDYVDQLDKHVSDTRQMQLIP
jgi:integrase